MPALLEGPDERGLRVARRRARRVRLGLERGRAELVALGERRQAALLLVGGDGLVAALLVGEHEPAKGDHGAGRAELGVRPVGRGSADTDRDRLAAGVGHLRCDRPLPDQVVQRGLVALDLAPNVVGRAELVAGGPDRLVRLLCVLHLAVVSARLGRDRVGAVQLARLVAGGCDRRLGQRGRVGAHVGDVTVLVEALGDPHGVLRAEPQLAARLLLQRRGHERRGRAAGIRLALDRADGERGAVERGGKASRSRLVDVDGVGGRERPVAGEVAALCHLAAVDGRQPRVEVAGCERRDDVPVLGGAELDPFPLALYDEPGRDRLHPAGRESLRHLAPQDR